VITFVDFVRSLGVHLTVAQRVLVTVAFDGVDPVDLPVEERLVAEQLFGPVDRVPPEARAVLVAVCGARGGKSYVLGALYALWRAFVADLRSLAPGEVASAVIVAPDLRLARQTLRYALGAAKSKPQLAACIVGDNSGGFTVRRPDGREVFVECLPATRGGSALRGRSLVAAVLDESAFFRDESYAVNDSELFKAVAPRVMPGGLVVIASTPWAESGLLFDEFQRNHTHPVTAIAVHAPTLLLRDNAPQIAAMVERERERDPDNARREFDAEFLAAGTGFFFDPEACMGAVASNLYPRLAPPESGRVGVGGDLALVRDAAALVVVHREGELYIVAEVLERRPQKGAPLRLSELVAEFEGVAARHGSEWIELDHHCFHAAGEHATKIALRACPGGQDGKLQTYARARDLLHSKRIVIPGQYRRLAQQLREVVSKPTAGGGLQITSPRRAGAHGDLVSAFVLAIHDASLCADEGYVSATCLSRRGANAFVLTNEIF